MRQEWTNNYNQRPAWVSNPCAIVLHATGGGTLESVIIWFKKEQGADSVSAHYVIGKDGTVVQMVRDEHRAWHAGVSSHCGITNVNDFSIGIELVNANDGIDPYPATQTKAALNLMAALMKKYGIRADDVVSHKEISEQYTGKYDPKGLDMDVVRSTLEQMVAPHKLSSMIGLHEPGGEYLFDERGGWITFTHELGRDPSIQSGFDYTPWQRQGIGCIARLNHGYGSAGTIPAIQYYANFAQRCANWVQNSQGCWLYIIGNEPNLSAERPGGVPITWENYLDCFLLCYDKIKAVNPAVLVLPAPVGPWNVETGDWLEYQRNIVSELVQRGKLDGGVIHAYTHEYDVKQVTVDDIRHGWQWHFKTYQDQAHSFPQGVPLYITECNPVSGWEDRNIGWIVAVYEELARWNEAYPSRKIYCCCMYRWPLRHDQPQWAISTRANVIADLNRAIEIGFPVETEKPPEPPTNGDDEMEVVYSTGFEDGKFPPYAGQEHLLIPEGWHPDWVQGDKPGPVRPETQPEDKERGDRGIHTGRYGFKICHAYSFFDGVIYRRVPAFKGKDYQLAAWATAESQGGLQCRVGIDPTGGNNFRADVVQWGEGWGTDYEGFQPYSWRKLSTPKVCATGDYVTIFLNVRCRDAVQVNAGFFDDIELLAATDETPTPPTPVTGGYYEVDLRITGKIRFVPE